MCVREERDREREKVYIVMHTGERDPLEGRGIRFPGTEVKDGGTEPLDMGLPQGHYVFLTPEPSPHPRNLSHCG